MSDEAMIRFIDPSSGESYYVKPTKATVMAAEKLGFMPATIGDDERAEKVMERE